MDDICLQPHALTTERKPSRGDSAADTACDQAIALAPKSQLLEPDDPELPMTHEISGPDSAIIPAAPGSTGGGGVSQGTLYDKLGGPEALEAAVDLFYEKVLADERLAPFFEGTNMMRLVIKQVGQHC